MYDYLNERERFVIINHPAMSYSQIAAHFAVSPERIRQVKVAALRKIKDHNLQERMMERGRERVEVSLLRSDVWLMIRALEKYQLNLVRNHADMRRKTIETDPDEEPVMRLIDTLNQL